MKLCTCVCLIVIIVLKKNSATPLHHSSKHEIHEVHKSGGSVKELVENQSSCGEECVSSEEISETKSVEESMSISKRIYNETALPTMLVRLGPKSLNKKKLSIKKKPLTTINQKDIPCAAAAAFIESLLLSGGGSSEESVSLSVEEDREELDEHILNTSSTEIHQPNTDDDHPKTLIIRVSKHHKKTKATSNDSKTVTFSQEKETLPQDNSEEQERVAHLGQPTEITLQATKPKTLHHTTTKLGLKHSPRSPSKRRKFLQNKKNPTITNTNLTAKVLATLEPLEFTHATTDSPTYDSKPMVTNDNFALKQRSTLELEKSETTQRTAELHKKISSPRKHKSPKNKSKHKLLEETDQLAAIDDSLISLPTSYSTGLINELNDKSVTKQSVLLPSISPSQTNYKLRKPYITKSDYEHFESTEEKDIETTQHSYETKELIFSPVNSNEENLSSGESLLQNNNDEEESIGDVLSNDSATEQSLLEEVTTSTDDLIKLTSNQPIKPKKVLHKPKLRQRVQTPVVNSTIFPHLQKLSTNVVSTPIFNQGSVKSVEYQPEELNHMLRKPQNKLKIRTPTSTKKVNGVTLPHLQKLPTSIIYPTISSQQSEEATDNQPEILNPVLRKTSNKLKIQTPVDKKKVTRVTLPHLQKLPTSIIYPTISSQESEESTNNQPDILLPVLHQTTNKLTTQTPVGKKKVKGVSLPLLQKLPTSIIYPTISSQESEETTNNQPEILLPVLHQTTNKLTTQTPVGKRKINGVTLPHLQKLPTSTIYPTISSQESEESTNNQPEILLPVLHPTTNKLTTQTPVGKKKVKGVSLPHLQKLPTSIIYPTISSQESEELTDNQSEILNPMLHKPKNKLKILTPGNNRIVDGTIMSHLQELSTSVISPTISSRELEESTDNQAEILISGLHKPRNKSKIRTPGSQHLLEFPKDGISTTISSRASEESIDDQPETPNHALHKSKTPASNKNVYMILPHLKKVFTTIISSPLSNNESEELTPIQPVTQRNVLHKPKKKLKIQLPTSNTKAHDLDSPHLQDLPTTVISTLTPDYESIKSTVIQQAKNKKKLRTPASKKIGKGTVLPHLQEITATKVPTLTYGYPDEVDIITETTSSTIDHTSEINKAFRKPNKYKLKNNKKQLPDDIEVILNNSGETPNHNSYRNREHSVDPEIYVSDDYLEITDEYSDNKNFKTPHEVQRSNGGNSKIDLISSSSEEKTKSLKPFKNLANKNTKFSAEVIEDLITSHESEEDQGDIMLLAINDGNKVYTANAKNEESNLNVAKDTQDRLSCLEKLYEQHPNLNILLNNDEQKVPPVPLVLTLAPLPLLYYHNHNTKSPFNEQVSAHSNTGTCKHLRSLLLSVLDSLKSLDIPLQTLLNVAKMDKPRRSREVRNIRRRLLSPLLNKSNN